MVGFFFFFFFVIVSIVIIIMLRRNAGYLQSCTVDRNIQKSSDFLSPLARTQETFSSSMTSPNTIWKIKLSSTISSKSETKHMFSIVFSVNHQVLLHVQYSIVTTFAG